MRRLPILLIFLLALSLRVIWLDKYPSGFTPDEASFGYDAYSILKTGRDQWGKPLPLVLESFGDFKSPLYAYLSVPSIAAFGLNKFAVRLPNAILGSLAILVVYFLARELFQKDKPGIWAAFLLAVSPWHIQLSRGAFEANLTTFFLPLGILLFLKKRYTLGAFIFGLNLFSYHSAKIITPAVVLLLALFQRKTIDLKSKNLWIGGLIFAFFLAVMGYTFLLGGGARAQERSIAEGALEEAFAERIRSSRFFHNKYTVIFDRFLTNYMTYFSPQFFFTRGPGEGTYGMIPGRGVLYWFVIPFVFMARKIFFQEKYKWQLIFLFVWILVSAVPASLATGVGYHANRVAAMMPAFEILLGVGAAGFVSWINKNKFLISLFYSFILLLFLSFAEDYIFQSPHKIGRAMLSGNLEVAQWLSENKGEKKVVVSKALSEPHIYIAFANKWNPDDYQKHTKLWNYKEQGVSWVDQMPSYYLGDYIFQGVNWKQNSGKAGTLLVGRPEEFTANIIPDKIIYYPDESPAIYVVDPEKQLYAKVN